MTPRSSLRAAAAAVVFGALAAAPALAQAPAAQAPATPAPAAQTQTAPAPAAPAAPQQLAAPHALPAQPAHPAKPHRAMAREQRAAILREHRLAHHRTAVSELEAAQADLREGRPYAASIALDHAETAVLNLHEAALLADNEAAREIASSNVVGFVESARFNLHRDRAWSERMIADSLRGLRDMPKG